MNKLSLSLVTISCLLSLAACSTSRGGDAVNTSRYLTEKPNPPSQPNSQTDNTSNNASQSEETASPSTISPPPSSTPSTISPPPSSTSSTISPSTSSTSVFKDSLFIPSREGDLVGAILKIKADGEIKGQNPLNNGYEDLNELMLDDTRIILFNTYDYLSNNGSDGFKALSNQDVSKDTPTAGTISGYAGGFGNVISDDPRQFRNMRFGIVNFNNESNLFVQGNLTPVIGSGVQNGHYPMPKTGIFSYEKGYALYGKDGNYQQFKAEVVANFTDKKLDVTLKENNVDKLSFSALIEENTFSGKTNGVETKGAFYGSRATEVGGLFYQTEGVDKGKNGVFGAVYKQYIE